VEDPSRDAAHVTPTGRGHVTELHPLEGL
jgi:hypothetical protein